MASLDLLRLLAASMVVAYHFLYFSWVEPAGDVGIRDAIGVAPPFQSALPFSWWGWIGVELFFVISGYVIAMSANGKTAMQFAIGRYSRIMPGLLVFATLSLLVVLGNDLAPTRAALINWARSIVLFPRGPWIDGVIWTLTIEAIFYAVIFVCLAMGRGHWLPGLQRIWLAACALLLGLVATQWAGVDLGQAGRWAITFADGYMSRVLLLTTGPFFIVGMFAYEIRQRGLSVERLTGSAVAVACCIVALLMTAGRSEAVEAMGQSAWTPALVWLGLTLTLLAAIFYEGGRTMPSGYVTVARKMGLMTYPLYLLHNMSGGWLLGRLLATGMSPWLAAAAAFALCVAVSYLFAVAAEPWLRRLMLPNWLKTLGTPRTGAGDTRVTTSQVMDRPLTGIPRPMR